MGLRSRHVPMGVDALVLVLVAAACTPTPSDDAASPTDDVSPTDATSSTPSDDAGPVALQRRDSTVSVPPLSGLVAAEPIVAPGDTVTMPGSPLLSGQLLLVGPEGDEASATFTDGHGSIDFPAGATVGEWRATVTGDTGAMAAGVVEALAGRVLCVDVDPIDVASQDVVVRATDLTGTPITEATVTVGDPQFGTVTTEGKQLIDGVFRATYTGGTAAGEDVLTVEVGGGEHWSTTVLARVATGFGYIMEGQYRVELNPEADDVPAPGRPLSVTLVAGSCTGRNGPWEGLLVLEAGPILTMIAIGGAAGEIGESLSGAPTEPGDDPSILLPDIGLAMVTSIGMPIDAAVLAPVAAEILAGIDDPYRSIVLATTFRLPPTGYTALIIGTDASGYSLAVHPRRRDVAQLTAGGTHLLNTVIERGPCPFDSDVADLARKLVPNIKG